MEITKERILQLEHDLIGEVSAWEQDEPDRLMKLAFYNEGVHDMASRLLACCEDTEVVPWSWLEEHSAGLQMCLAYDWVKQAKEEYKCSQT